MAGEAARRRARNPRALANGVRVAGEPPLPASLRASVEPERWRQVAELVRTGVASPQTTSMGRLFDAVSALCAIRPAVNYEGQAATELEAIADPAERGSYPLRLSAAGELDARPTVLAVLGDVTAGVAPGLVSARFHNAIAVSTRRA